VYFLTPDVVGVNLTGKLHPACTATDLVLTVTEMLRKAKVVGKFVEFFGAGTESLSVTDRATLANMAPEYGATMGFFPVDDKTLEYFRGTGRTDAEIDAFAAYFKAQGMFGIPRAGQIDYSQTLELDLATVMPSLAGPKRPQDRIQLDRVKASFTSLFSKPVAENGFARKPEDLGKAYQAYDGTEIRNGDVLIAAITSCTNTSNPGVLLAAGLLAKKAVELGLSVKPHVKTSLAPGSRVVTEYLTRAGLLPYLEKLGFNVAAYGCTTCIGNAGPLAQPIEDAIVKNDLVCAAVLSGNRNFEARIHPNIRANFLASPPLVVAYAIAGTMLRDFRTEPLGKSKDGRDVYIGHVWPSADEVKALLRLAMDAPTFRRLYGNLAEANPMWKKISAPTGQVYSWPKSTYIAEPPFFKDFSMQPGTPGDVRGARILGIFGDSVTTDHISPAGSIKPTSPAGIFLQENDVAVPDFNSYGARRGNHEVMMRGTFANVRIKNLMLGGKEGGFTRYQGEEMPIYDAAIRYMVERTPTVVFGGEEYGTGSSRDWAAKGTQLLGVKAVVARSFERIHRSNLVGMGVLPLQFLGDDSAQSLGLKGDETIDVLGLDDLRPQQELTLVVTRADGSRVERKVKSRIDTAIEVDYYKHGGILPYVLRELIAKAGPAKARAA
jgi:aconitate hydratase